MSEGEKKPRRQRTRRERQLSERREDDPVFAGVVVGFARAVQRMFFSAPFDDEPPDDAGTAGSRVPRRPPANSGSGSVALAEPLMDVSDLDEEPTPHTRPSR